MLICVSILIGNPPLDSLEGARPAYPRSGSRTIKDYSKIWALKGFPFEESSNPNCFSSELDKLVYLLGKVSAKSLDSIDSECNNMIYMKEITRPTSKKPFRDIIS